jgi:hypothetical protein
MKRSSLVAAVLLAQSIGTFAWVQSFRTYVSTSSPEPLLRQQRTVRHLRVSPRRAGLTASSDLNDAPVKNHIKVKNLKRVVATEPAASAPAPVKRKEACASKFLMLHYIRTYLRRAYAHLILHVLLRFFGCVF